MQDLEALKFPIGKYAPPAIITASQTQQWIADLAELPVLIAQATRDLSNEQLEVPYREGGWTVRQVVHHLADSHINAYTRVHLTLTEENPSIRPYFEDRWANLAVAKSGDIQLSIAILEAIHQRLVALLQTLQPADFERTYFHPESKQQNTLAYLVGNYAWHGLHHLAHIKSTLT